MSGYDVGHVAYLVLLLILVGGWLATRRTNLRQLLRHASSWAVIFTLAIVGASLWTDIRRDLPSQATVTQSGAIEVARAYDGHYYLTLGVNGTPVNFMVDTGATDIVLSRHDAERAGIDADRLMFTGRAGTANGTVATAPVRLDELTLGPLADHDVRAQVNAGEMDLSLLGMAYLQRFARIEITGDRLVLER
ncbi:retropepsin-like aspartic protease family protein [Roseitranquillus sediminis]|uniref:retropepsin-like aspartic protease family protein n=1 Tax=Roseitranquillus sediminis TaxID=2809051 RepID=UPI001D0C7E53|nr:TIGR02281 family clan AA aspartic protease [Roseitranquillus sediminis]MBM9594375.1 TIGR02281 family clan AA aspartic protease [Roseitranquillus sediminis]